VVKRRSLDDALSKDELAFYATGEKSLPSSTTPAPSVPAAPSAAAAQIPERSLEASSQDDHALAAPTRAVPLAFVGLNTRVSPATKRALKKAAMERELDLVEPFTLQDIVDEAVADWLRKEGYLRYVRTPE
jgi:hypothetical protein